MHVLVLIMFFHFFCYFIFISFHLLSRFSFPLLFFVYVSFNHRNISILSTKNDSGHFQKWNRECKKWNIELLLISSLWLPKILIRCHEFAEPIRSALPSRQVPRKEIQLWRKKCICRHKSNFKDSWRHFKVLCRPSLNIGTVPATWWHEFRKAPKANSSQFLLFLPRTDIQPWRQRGRFERGRFFFPQGFKVF